jgi:transposase
MIVGVAMTYRAIHTKKNGAKYVYEVTGYWDKEKKQGRNRQICLGRLDEATGEIIASAKAPRAAKQVEVTASSKIIGPALLLDAVEREIGLGGLLERCFPGKGVQILSLAYFLVQKGLPLSRCEMWSNANRHPYGEAMPSQRVSDLLKTISEDGRQTFFSKWMRQLAEKECLCYDITSISSYAEGNEYLRWGYNRDHDPLPQINLAMLFGQSSGLPGYYRRLPGSISDVSALKTTVASLGFMGQSKLTFVLDRGFYSISNIDAMFAGRCGFVMAIPARQWVETLYDECRNDILSPLNRRNGNEKEVLYATTRLHKCGGHRCYAHVYFNNVRAAEETDALALKLLGLMKELETKNEQTEHAEDYKRFFTVKETPKRGRRVIPNTKAEEDARKKYAGFSCILTTKKMDAMEALEIYRRKEVVENSFDDLKNHLDMKRLRIHSSPAMDSRLFIQFVALILLSKVRLVSKNSDALSTMSVREIMEAMETIVEVRYARRYKRIITEAGPLQRRIMDSFGVSLDS